MVAARMVEYLLGSRNVDGCRSLILGMELVRWVTENIGQFVSPSDALMSAGLEVEI